MNIKQSYDEYSDSYNNIIKVLSDILDSREITEGSQELLNEAYTNYNEDYTNTKKLLEGIKDASLEKKVEELDGKKLDANIENVLKVLSQNGLHNSLYMDEEGRVLIDMQSIPKLTLLVQKLSLIAKGLNNDEESSITIAPEFIELLSNSDIILRAKNILLEGLVTGNGYFKVLEDGSIEATNANIKGTILAESGKLSADLEVLGLNVSGNLTADTLNVRQINCQDLGVGLTSDINITVNPSAVSLTTILEDEGIYNSLQQCLELLPKQFNGYTVNINILGVTNENITIKGFNGGNLNININADIKGYIRGINCSSEIKLIGNGSSQQVLISNYKLTGNLNMRQGPDTSYNLVQTIPIGAVLLVTNIQSNNWGYTTYDGLSGWISLNTSYTVKDEVYKETGTSSAIKPSDLYTKDGCNLSIYFENCPYVEMTDLEIYGKTGDSNNYSIESRNNSYIHVTNIKITGSENGFIADKGGRIFEKNINGKVNSIAQRASQGGTIYLANGTILGGSMVKDDDSQIVYDTTKVSQDTSSSVGTNDNTTTPVSTVTIISNSANSYRHNVYTGWKNDNTARQGDYGYGDCDGIWLFGSKLLQLKGKTITKITITVNRMETGIYGNITSTLKMHNHQVQPSGAPTYVNGWSQDFTMPVNTTKTIEITDSIVLNALKNGTCAGFGVQGLYDRNHYSTFDGICTIVATIQ